MWISVAICIASLNVSAPTGITMNSWKSRSLEASLPPLIRLTNGTGSTCALALR